MSSVPGRLVEAPREPALLRGTWRRRLVFCALFAAATLVGRSAQADGAHLAIFWPASAVGLLWVAGSPGRRGRVVDGAVVLALTVALRVLTHMPVAESAVLACAAVVQAFTGALTYRRLQPDGFHLARPAHLRSLALSSLSGALASTPVAALAFAVTPGVPVPPSAAQWLLRTAVSTFVVLAIVLRAAESRPGAPGSEARWPERCAVSAAFVVAYGLVFWLLPDAPIAFLVLPVAVWVALRRTTTAATVNVVLATVVVVVSTWADRGPWAGLDPDVQALCADAFVGTLAFVTLVLALYRDESVENARAAAEQADLLTAVFGSISDAVCVFDRHGDSLLRNPAAETLLGTKVPVQRRQWDERYGFFHPDGTRFADAELPIVRALAGESVDGLDLRLHTPRTPEGLHLNVSAHPLPHGHDAVWSGGVVAAFHDVSEVRAAAARVRRAHDLMSDVLRAATEHSIIAVDTRGTVTLFNEGAERMLGWSAQEVVGGDVARVLDPRTPAERGDEPTTGRSTYVRADGSTVPVSLTTSPMHDEAGRVVGWISMATDVSELENSEELFRVALDTAPVGIAILGTAGADAGRLLRVNRALCRFTARPEPELLGAGFAGLVEGEEPFDDAFADVLYGFTREQQLDVVLRTADGRRVQAQLTASLVRPRGGAVSLLCLVEDVTERRAAQAELRHTALHDPLTGLPNRRLFLDRLEHAVAAAARGAGHAGLLYVDLDGFKAVNDTAGHQAGDDLLVQVARLLTGCVRPGDSVARLGGDEFAVVCSGPTSEADLVAIGTRVLAALRDPLDVGGHQAVVGASIGVRWCSGPASVDELVRDADAAMYEAKRAGKGRVVVHRGVREGTVLAAVASQPDRSNSVQ
ncbi:diguanylate cyclase domain-containing protein [Kineococcus rhizosphaerae]|uniref:PAS domain S-box-containing protein/diguanylate cyclase (GGDEF)-like protein n=1 Tax=Kineococcus rhizosphaerae TaxID=559628 RepID=A0A2T0R288_9ACTN|nr:diguanylate cyclase [Kineococcus rhizosphaerae]PRY13894.1 PAS domain S-box-containing protein/diguanylate cyclase (GGDEF)-like protein [Kineococcus rhizosphaerae]